MKTCYCKYDFEARGIFFNSLQRMFYSMQIESMINFIHARFFYCGNVIEYKKRVVIFTVKKNI